MLTEIVQPQPGGNSNSDTDLSALAEHLSIIAEALRKTTAGSDRPNANEVSAMKAQTRSKDDEPAQARQGRENPLETSVQQTNFTDNKIYRRNYAELAREAYAMRRRRGVIFSNDELIGEPAWDILLDLYIAHSESKAASVSSACIGSAAPPTTGLRWLGVLSEQGLILREHDSEDQRRVLVKLTGQGLAAMDEYFASIAVIA